MALESLENLIKLLQSIRGNTPTQCAWTRAQTPRSLAPQTLGECYELLEAIEQNDIEAIKSELSDLLYHVLFYAEMGREKNQFDLNALAEVSIEKHERRMPPPELRQNMTPDEVNNYWQAAKKQQAPKPQHTLSNINWHAPALTVSYNLQETVSEIGFDWIETKDVQDKLTEEMTELNIEIEKANQAHPNQTALEHEIGDVLFSIVNLSRHLAINPSEALRAANRRFTKRFKIVEAEAKKNGDILSDCTIEKLNQYWALAKDKTA